MTRRFDEKPSWNDIRHKFLDRTEHGGVDSLGAERAFDALTHLEQCPTPTRSSGRSSWAQVGVSSGYYAVFGAVAAPAAQTALYAQQAGVTMTGSAGMAWHQVEIQVDATNVTWIVDGLTIATVSLADDTVNPGNNIFFGHSDTNGTSSNDPNAGALLFTLIDNVRVVTPPIPEPSSSVLFAVGIAGLLGFGRLRGR
jgi:hypothetical protein